MPNVSVVANIVSANVLPALTTAAGVTVAFKLLPITEFDDTANHLNADATKITIHLFSSSVWYNRCYLPRRRFQ